MSVQRIGLGTMRGKAFKFINVIAVAILKLLNRRWATGGCLQPESFKIGLHPSVVPANQVSFHFQLSIAFSNLIPEITQRLFI